MFYDDDLGTENNFFSVCLISKYSSVTINVYLYSVHLGIRNVTAVFQFPFKIRTSDNWEWNVIVEFLVNVLLFNLWLLIWLMFGY